MTLKFETSANLKPIKETVLASKEKRKVSIEVLADPSTLVRAAILIVGPAFTIGELQTSWREIVPAKITTSGDPAIAQIDGLDPRELHMLRVSALERGGTVQWESPLVALSPAGQSPQRGRFWLIIFGAALIAFLVMRWRASGVVEGV